MLTYLGKGDSAFVSEKVGSVIQGAVELTKPYKFQHLSFLSLPLLGGCHWCPPSWRPRGAMSMLLINGKDIQECPVKPENLLETGVL